MSYMKERILGKITLLYNMWSTPLCTRDIKNPLAAMMQNIKKVIPDEKNRVLSKGALRAGESLFLIPSIELCY